jgi:hypothetical protein
LLTSSIPAATHRRSDVAFFNDLDENRKRGEDFCIQLPSVLISCFYSEAPVMNSDTKARFLGLIGLGTIAVWLTISLGSDFYLCIVSLRWPKVPVRVNFSGVNTGSSTLGTWWAPDVEYGYQVSGRAYHSETIRYMMPVFYEKEEAQTVLAAYPPEGQTTAAYDPQNPARSVLEPGVPPSMWKKALIPPFFWGLIAYIYYEIVHPHRRFMLRSNPDALGEEA